MKSFNEWSGQVKNIYECVINTDLLLRLLFVDTLSILLHGSLEGLFEPQLLCHGDNGVIQCA